MLHMACSPENLKIESEISRENKRKSEIIKEFPSINKNAVDRGGKICYKYICSPGNIVPDFEQKYKTSFDNEKAGAFSCSFVIEGREKGEHSHVHFYGKQGQYRAQVVRC